MDSLLLGPDAQINHTIGVLRSAPAEVQLVDKVALAPGAFMAIDPAGEVKGRCETGGKHLLQLDYTINKAPRWLALHLAIGGVDLGDSAVLGVVCKSRAPESMTFRLCLRSATPSGFVDAFLPKHVVAYAKPSTHIDLLKLEDHENVPPHADWRELILFFQTRSAICELLDLRVFIV